MWTSLCLVGLLVSSAASLRARHDRVVQEEVVDLDRLVVAASQRLEGILATIPSPHANGTANATRVPNAPHVIAVHRNNTKVLVNATQLKQQRDSLSNLFAHLKANIANSNKEQVASKKKYALQVENARRRLDLDRKKLQLTNLTEFERGLLKNRTLAEEQEVKYWTQNRDLNHGIFHDTLKMTHGLMSRVKTVMDAYKQVLANGHIDPHLAEQLHSVSATLPRSSA
mmetsp:Transcript_37490/g.74384  ORF Transcript_37490/g.74384 Transcript_37490/m.74384 type:complete len:227 (-) Transcript_37490:91-771(-)